MLARTPAALVLSLGISSAVIFGGAITYADSAAGASSKAEATVDHAASSKGQAVDPPEWSIGLLATKGPYSKTLTKEIVKILARNGSPVGDDADALDEGGTGIEIKVSRRRRRWTAVVYVRGGKGKDPIATATFKARNTRILSRSIRRGLWKKLGPTLKGRKGEWEAAIQARNQTRKETEVEAKKEPAEPTTKVVPKTKSAPVGGSVGHGAITKDLIYEDANGKKWFRFATNAARRHGEITIDGNGDESAWQVAPETMGEWMQRPKELGTPIGKTYFRVLYDDNALYVYIHAKDPEPKKIGGILTRNDTFANSELSDWLVVLLDPTLSRRDSYGFQVNPEGVRIDYRIYNDAILDPTYDPVYEVATMRLKDGWAAEYRLPYSQMRVKSGYQDRWGLQIYRRVARTGEHVVWSPYPYLTGRTTSQYGDLLIHDEIQPKRALEILPYVVAGLELRNTPSEDTVNEPMKPLGRLGGDMRIALTDELKLTATVNPDFGQVEADPAQVNLTDRETFFQELRPFFTKDADLFEMTVGESTERLFYSRRIGAPPVISQAGAAAYVREPRETTIYGAGKISGFLPGHIKVGTLTAVTSEEESVGQLPDGTVNTETIAPMTVYNVVQLGKVLREGASEFRLMGTSVNRFLNRANIHVLPREAYSLGLQTENRFLNNDYAVYAKAFATYVRGRAEAIAFTQRASSRYFQRPDAHYVEFDPTRTSLSGEAFDLKVAKLSGNVHASAGVDARTPGFETNDAGYLQNADYINAFANLSFQEWIGGKQIRVLSGNVFWNTIANFGGHILRHQLAATGTMVRASQSQMDVGLSHDFNRLDARQLRGGPAIAGSDSTTINLSFLTSPERKISARFFGAYSFRTDSNSRVHRAGIDLYWSLMSNLGIELLPQFELNIDDTQYITRLDGMSGDPTYLFGNIKQQTASLTTRVNFTATPHLSFQVYAQPFISVGEYRSFRRPVNLRARDYDRRFSDIATSPGMDGIDADLDGDGMTDFSFGDPSFSFTSINTNVVVRWEYRPGSYAYAIWSHAASGNAPDGRLTGDDFSNVFGSDGAQVFLLKVSYWWNR